jgi:hypothetical protein
LDESSSRFRKPLHTFPDHALAFHPVHLLPDSNWVLPIVLVMQILWLLGLVEMFCLRGSLGSNRFGPDPLAEIEDNSTSTSPPSKGWDQQSELEIVPPSASPPGGMHVKRSP